MRSIMFGLALLSIEARADNMFSRWWYSKTGTNVSLNKENTVVIGVSFKFKTPDKKFQGFVMKAGDEGLNTQVDAGFFERVGDGFGFEYRSISDKDLELAENKKKKFLELLNKDAKQTNRVFMYSGHGNLFPKLDKSGHWDGNSMTWAIPLPDMSAHPECYDFKNFVADYQKIKKDNPDAFDFSFRSNQRSDDLVSGLGSFRPRPSPEMSLYVAFDQRLFKSQLVPIHDQNTTQNAYDRLIADCTKSFVTVEEIVQPGSSFSTVVFADSCHSGAIQESSNVACGASCQADQESADSYYSKDGTQTPGGILSGFVDHCSTVREGTDGKISLREIFGVIPKAFVPYQTIENGVQNPSVKIAKDANDSVNEMLDHRFILQRRVTDRAAPVSIDRTH